MPKKHIFYLDLLRISATVAVICLHAGLGKFSGWCNIMFVMISGALWLSKKEIDIKKLYTKNILRIIIAFLFWSAFYTFFHTVIFPKVTGEYPTVKEILVMFLEGRYHLWFCFLIVGLYIGLPFWKVISQNEMLLKYFLAVTFVFSFLIPCIQNIPILEWTAWRTQNIHWDWAEYVFYFMLGYFFHTHPLAPKQSLIIYLTGIVSLISIGYGFGDAFSLLQSLAIACLIFTLFQNIESKMFQKNSYIEKISVLCFGVYLIHDFFLTVCRMIATSVFHFEIGMGIKICTMLFTLFAGFGSIYLIHKIPHVGKYIT